ncbi:SDR family oxidoreductase [Candidatus Gracilibacteria bacterium]|nr:SDR family oxidoreductase [Candidatus Gracilibacteria bacterium]
MRAFVTGSTGLLGNNLVRALLVAGHEVVALVRSRSKAQRQFGDLEVEIVEGDILQPERFVAALKGCDAFFHTAAFFREYYQPGDHQETLRVTNIDATIALLNAAEAAGVQQTIYVSSSGVIGMQPDGRPGDETTGPDKRSLENLYFRSKVEAEDAVFAWIKTHQMPVVLILPGWMFGPGDAAPTGAGGFLLDHLNRRLPGKLRGSIDIVDARDVATAMVNAVEHGRPGERYIIGGTQTTIAALHDTIAQVSGVPAPAINLPTGLVTVLAHLSDAIASTTRQRSAIPLAGIRTLTANKSVSSAKAARELGARFRPLRATIHDTIAWYLEQQPEKVVQAPQIVARMRSAVA